MFRSPCLLLAFATLAWAAPITPKELDLMVRMGLAEAEILRDAQTRRLIAPITPEIERSLLANGATPKLLAGLKQGRFELPAAEAQAATTRERSLRAAAAEEQARDAAAVAERPRPLATPPPKVSPRMMEAFSKRLIRLNASGQPEEVAAGSLKDVQLYALYYSAHWCPPCRKFTPELVEFYKRFKPKHPEFELIFISGDRDAGAMAGYMKEARMPWPAVRFDGIDGNLRQWAASGIPYLVFVNSAGEAVTPEGKRKEWTDPQKTLAALDNAAK